MKIKMKEMAMVTPEAETPSGSLWLSNLDLISTNHHVPTVYFYCHNGPANFFDAVVLKAALSRALMAFYPVAGRFRRDKNGRVEIECNGEGVLFVEAETEAVLDDLGDFIPKAENDGVLIPAVDCSKGISTYPLLVMQVTHFKCGGVSLGIGIHHYVVDGISAMHFINTWSDIARGLDVAVPPFVDRTLLRPRNTVSNPKFTHIEFQPPSTLKNRQHAIAETSVSIFKLTRTLLDALKFNCNKDKHQDKDKKTLTTYTSYEVLTGHIWRCLCRARGLPEDQETMMYLICDGRSRLKPQLPPEFFGNAVFTTVVVATSGELQSGSLRKAANKVHDAIARMDNDYLSSALDYLELQPDLKGCTRGAHCLRCPNLGITSWLRLPFYDADFGWGRPIFAGPGRTPSEGKGFLIPSPTSDGSLLLAISLPKPHMMIFEKLFYDIN